MGKTVYKGVQPGSVYYIYGLSSRYLVLNRRSVHVIRTLHMYTSHADAGSEPLRLRTS